MKEYMEFKNRSVRIGDVKLGCVVYHERRGFGHVTRFSTNPFKELILVILWQDEVEAEIHPSNVEFMS